MIVQNGTVNVNGGSITKCSASSYGGGFYTSGGTLSFNGTSFSGCSANTGGTSYTVGGTATLTDCTVYGTNMYMTKDGTLTLDNTDFTYTGTGYGLYLVGADSKSTGVINVKNGSSVKATAGSATYTKYGTINIENSEIIAAGSYCTYFNTGGKVNYTNAYAANIKSDGGYVFYSGTGNNASKLTVNSGYYAGNNITGWYTTSGTNNRIFIEGGYYSNDAFNDKTQYSSVSLKSITPVTKEIGGVSYSFPYQAK